MDRSPLYSIKKGNRTFLGYSYYYVCKGDKILFNNLQKIVAVTICAALNNAYREGLIDGMS